MACPGIEPHPHGFCNISMRMEHAISMRYAEIKFLFTFNFIACLPTVFDHVNELRKIKSSQKYRYICPFGSFYDSKVVIRELVGNNKKTFQSMQISLRESSLINFYESFKNFTLLSILK